MEDVAPFEVNGLEYSSVWQWLACDKALSVSDVRGFMILRKSKPLECKTLINHIHAPHWDMFAALKAVAKYKCLFVPNAKYMVEDRVVGIGVTPMQLDHGLLPIGLNLWGRALSIPM
jgi:predicted NAD-dependent protein-ADP-ribosyltransferase YbiA (DUF1768 family)|tara:strand:+ start:14591 stop:14941 length:351 start_codon:yes stop_codon:yes gene_type:complete